MITRYVCLLLDIDDTVAGFNSSRNSVYWNGGSSEIWKEFLEHLKNAAREKGIGMLYGIATFKKSHDLISIKVQEKLDSLLDKNLIFFTDSKPKAKGALSPAKEHIQTCYKTTMNDSDLWIFDDTPGVIQDALAHKHQASLADFVNLEPEKEKDALIKLFQPLYQALGIAMPDVSCYQIASAQPFKKGQEEKVDRASVMQAFFAKPSQLKRADFTAEDLEKVSSLDSDDEKEKASENQITASSSFVPS